MMMLKKIRLVLLILSLFSFSLLFGTSRIMPLGDSITWDYYFGEQRTDAQRHSYRNYLWYKLKEVGYDADFVGSRTTGSAIEPYFDGDNEGHIGWSSYDIAERVYHFLEMNPADIILLHIGTNDFDSSPAGVEQILDEVDRFESENGRHIEVILARIILLPSNSSLIREFNDNVEAMARRRIDSGDDIHIVDMQSGAGLDYQTDLIDNIHPNDCGYEKMANVWFSALTGNKSPGITYTDCGNDDSNEDSDEGDTEEEEADEAVDALYAFPTTLVDSGYIISIEVDEEAQTVTFTTSIPDSGIRF